MRKIYYNGKYLDESEAKISIYDSALMFGDMVFEMTRSFNQKQFLLEEHLARLFRGMSLLEIDIPETIDDLVQICDEVQKLNAQQFGEYEEHRLMINVSRGPLSIYEHLFEDVRPTVIVADFPLRWTVQSMGPLFSEGINVVIPSQRAIPARLMDPKIKNRSRMWYQMANIEVARVLGKNNWALLIDEDGFIAEGTGSNFFIVDRAGNLVTPEGRNVLRGISRDYVLELARESGINVIEKNIEPYDIFEAKEAFMTATPFCIVPVTRIHGKSIGVGAMGPITKLLLRLWSVKVGVDIQQQIVSYYDDWVESAKDSIKSGASPYQFIQVK